MAEIDFDDLDFTDIVEYNPNKVNKHKENVEDFEDIINDSEESEDDDDDDIIEEHDDEEDSEEEEDSDDEKDIVEEEYIEEEEEIIEYKIEEKIKRSMPYLTKYERSNIISMRAQQIANNSLIFIDINTIPQIEKHMDKCINIKIATIIAKEELRLKKIPIYVERILPNGIIEKWQLSELKDIGAR